MRRRSFLGALLALPLAMKAVKLEVPTITLTADHVHALKRAQEWNRETYQYADKQWYKDFRWAMGADVVDGAPMKE